jgi:hypothetical protein
VTSPKTADGRAVVCRVLVRTEQLNGSRKVALVIGSRAHLRKGGAVFGGSPTWTPKGRPLSEISIERDATPREVATGMIGTDAIEPGQNGNGAQPS